MDAYGGGWMGVATPVIAAKKPQGAQRAKSRSRKMMKKARKTLRKSFRADKVACFSRLADEVQAADEVVNTRHVYKTIRTIFGKRSTCSEVLENSNRQPIADSNEKIEAWAAFFESFPNNPVNDCQRQISTRESLMSSQSR